MSKGGSERSMMLTLLAFKCQQHYGGGGRDSAGHRAFVGDRVLRSRLVRTCDDSFQSMAILTVPQSVGARTPTTTLDPTLIGKIVTTVTDSGTEPEHRGPLASHRSSSMQFGTMRATGVSRSSWSRRLARGALMFSRFFGNRTGRSAILVLQRASVLGELQL
jgi:hypothetical protein